MVILETAPIVVADERFPPILDFDFSSLKPKVLRRAVPRKGAHVAVSVAMNGEEHPLLVHWEFNGAPVIVWTGNVEDLLEWKDGNELVERLISYVVGS